MIPDDEWTCEQCGGPSDGYHSCPYASEMGDNDADDFCNCCKDCQAACGLCI